MIDAEGLIPRHAGNHISVGWDAPTAKLQKTPFILVLFEFYKWYPREFVIQDTL